MKFWAYIALLDLVECSRQAVRPLSRTPRACSSLRRSEREDQGAFVSDRWLCGCPPRTKAMFRSADMEHRQADAKARFVALAADGTAVRFAFWCACRWFHYSLWPTVSTVVAGRAIVLQVESLITLPCSHGPHHQAATRPAAAARWFSESIAAPVVLQTVFDPVPAVDILENATACTGRLSLKDPIVWHLLHVVIRSCGSRQP